MWINSCGDIKSSVSGRCLLLQCWWIIILSVPLIGSSDTDQMVLWWKMVLCVISLFRFYLRVMQAADISSIYGKRTHTHTHTHTANVFSAAPPPVLSTASVCSSLRAPYFLYYLSVCLSVCLSICVFVLLWFWEILLFSHLFPKSSYLVFFSPFPWFHGSSVCVCVCVCVCTHAVELQC